MPDHFHVMGDEVHYGAWLVLTLAQDIPATIRDEVIRLLDEASEREQAYADGYAEAEAEFTKPGDPY